MALIDEVQLRTSEKFLIRLSNPDAPEVTTLDVTSTGKLAIACDDTEADFEIEAGLTYDNGNSRHKSIAHDGVIAKLSMRGGQSRSGSQEAHDAYLTRLRALKGRILAKTSAVKVPTPDKSGTRPWSDSSHFVGIEPEHDERLE